MCCVQPAQFCLMAACLVACSQDICKLRADALGQQHPDVAAAHTAAGLALAELGDSDRAMQELQAAKSLLRQAAGAKQQLQLVEQAEKQVSCSGGR